MVFPLRRLPLLAAIKVIKSLDVEDFISFIRMSTRMKNLVKISKVHIHLKVFGDTNIGFQKLSDPGRTKWVQLFLEPNSSEKQTNLPFEPSVHRKSMPTFEENLEEYRRKMNEFVDMFTVTCADFDTRGVPSYICMKYLEYATNFGIKLKKVLVFISDEHGVDCGRNVLLACSQATELNVCLRGNTEQFHVLDRFREYKMDVFELTYSRNFEWFTVDHLFALINCSQVRIYDVNLSDADFNRFLKFWMTGPGKMETLLVALQWTDNRLDNLIDGQAVMNGIARNEIERDRKFEIERPDGIKANICCYGTRFSIGDAELFY